MASYRLPYSREYATQLVEAITASSPATTCAVINCNSAAKDGDSKVKFYAFPSDKAERAIWIALLARVDRSGKPWLIPRSQVEYVCSKHFLGNRRLNIPETDHYFPSLFPAILEEHCVPNVGPGEKKMALFPRAAGYYKHSLKTKEEDEDVISVNIKPLPEADADGLTWLELEELAYEQIYLPFANVFNDRSAELQMSDEFFSEQLEEIEEITARLQSYRSAMSSALQNMVQAKELHLRQSELNIIDVAPQGENQTMNAAGSSVIPRYPNPPKMNSFVLGVENSRIPIDVTMPSIIKDPSYTTPRCLQVGEKVFVLDKRRSENWFLSHVIRADYSTSTVEVKMSNVSRENSVPLSNVAYGSPPVTQIQLGCRILVLHNNLLKPGVVIEYPKWQNNNRYLILQESGLWMYSDQKSLFMICQQTAQTWQHVERGIALFVKEFFMTTEHPLLRVQIGEKIQAKRDNQWFEAEVIALDGNLIKVAFKHYGAPFASEWLYAGSIRLQEIFNLFNLSSDNVTRKHAKRKTARKKSEAYVEYADDALDVITLSDDETETDRASEDSDSTKQPESPLQQIQQHRKNTARKSTTPQPANRKPSKVVVDKDPGMAGSIVQEHIQPLAESKEFTPHTCGKNCLPINDSSLKHTAYSPYLMPHLMAWKRFVLETDQNKFVLYKTPCGRSLRNETETLTYLLLTECKIQIDQFSFDPEFDAFAVWKPKLVKKFVPDITNGEEPYPISLLNGIDTAEDNLVPYWSKRKPTKKAKRFMILEPEFLPCCTCKDQCLDRLKCQCQSLTIADSSSTEGETHSQAGYAFKSLSENIVTGIYECNSRCSCKSQCINKVAQNGVEVRLQIFKTLKKGYGVRTLHDIPKGRFLCTYAGTVLTDKEAEDQKQDTYFAELNYLDTIAQHKEDYESSVSSIDDDFSDDEDSRKGNAESGIDGDALRKLYFGKEDSFVMDALTGGNIGRYFNHSCDPNIFVQNVFVDTHDLRLPWVAFFTDRLIRAGEELTWDYNYEVGSVKGKKLLCYCNSSNCRKRLL